MLIGVPKLHLFSVHYITMVRWELWRANRQSVSDGRVPSIRTQALDRAMHIFWEKGFEGASLNDLTSAMGIKPASLYAAFGNKQALFERALDRYLAGPVAFMQRSAGATDSVCGGGADSASDSRVSYRAAVTARLYDDSSSVRSAARSRGRSGANSSRCA